MKLLTKGLLSAIAGWRCSSWWRRIDPAAAAAKCVKGDRKPPYTIGWANIYSVPTWMKQTQGTLEDIFNQLKEKGITDRLMITDAEGNANTQITQMQSMIDADVDAIVLIAGSATALDRVVADACKKGIVVINFDSLVSTDELTAKVNTDSAAWGQQAAEFLVEEARRQGQDPGHERTCRSVGERGSPRRRHASPAGQPRDRDPDRDQHALQRCSCTGSGDQSVVQPAADRRHPEPRWRAHRRRHPGHGQAGPSDGADDRRELPPVPRAVEGEEICDAWATMQPNWLAGLSVYVAVQALEGKDVPAFVKVPLPVIDNSNIDDYLARAKDFPADGYIYSPYSLETFEQLLANQ